MASLKFVAFIILQTIAFSIFLRSPYMMTTTSPSKQWADGPMALVTTPQYETKKVRIAMSVWNL